GPSAFVAALVASGLPTAPATFLGFLPSAAAARQRLLDAHRIFPHTMIIYEAPHRLLNTLVAIREAWGKDRRLAVAREVTKVQEEIFRGTVEDAVQHFMGHRPRGELTLVVAGAAAHRAAGTRADPAPQTAEGNAADRQAGETAKTMLRDALKEGVAPF